MPTPLLRKFILSSLVLLGTYAAVAQDKLQVLGAGSDNLSSFTTQARQPSAAWIKYNASSVNHPDAFTAPRTYDPGNMVELFSERTKYSKYFVNPSKPSEFVKEQSLGPIHYLNNGQWNTIDLRLTQQSTGIFEASHQEEPVGFDVTQKLSFIKATGSKVTFNKWELYGEANNGASTLLATADWNNYTVGDDGLFVTNIFPGIDAKLVTKKGGIKTSFIINSNQFSGFSKLIFRDAFQAAPGGVLTFANTGTTGTLSGDVDYQVAGKKVLSIAKAIAFTQTNSAGNLGLTDLSYTISGNKLSINVDGNYINTQLAYGKVVVDPFVQTVGTLLQATITGSMNCGSVTNSCNYTLNMLPPSGATITAVQVSFGMFVNSPLTANQGLFYVTAGTCSGGLTGSAANFGPVTINTPDSAGNFATAGFTDLLSATLLPCMPAASCPPPNIPFTLKFFNTYCAGPTNVCSNAYVSAAADFRVRIRGNTLNGTAIVRSSTAATICAGQSITLTRNPPTGGVAPFHYSWSPGGQITSSITVAPTVTTLYTSTITDSCGNTSIDTTTVNVLNANTPPTVVSPLNICQFDAPTPLTAVGTNLQWFTTATGGSPLPFAPTPPVNVPGTYNYYVAQSNPCGTSPRAQITVIVKPKPAPPTVVSPLGLCQYDTVSLNATGQNLRWYYTATGGQPGVPNIIVPTAYEDSLTYYVTQSVNGCASDRVRIKVYVSYKPNGVVLPTRLAVCEGELDSFNYFGNATPPQAVFNWSTVHLNNHIISGQGTTGPVVVEFDSSGTHFVRVQVNNRGCLSEIASQPVTVRPNPRIFFDVKENACQDEIVNVALSTISPGIDSFHYMFPGATIVYGAASGGPWGITYHTPGPKYITDTAFSRGCHSRPFVDTINVHPLPDARFTVDLLSICAGDTVHLSMLHGDSDTHYYYTPDNFYDAGNIYHALGTVKADGYIKVRALTKWGCEASDSVHITAKPCCEMFFPNAFSPNKDTHNDVFRPVTNGHQEIKTFRIINRWGQVVYETKEDRAGWNGQYNGKEQDVGTYYYYISYRCEGSGEFLEQKGEVLLIR